VIVWNSSVGWKVAVVCAAGRPSVGGAEIFRLIYLILFHGQRISRYRGMNDEIFGLVCLVQPRYRVNGSSTLEGEMGVVLHEDVE
jgi:hypothetical protein